MLTPTTPPSFVHLPNETILASSPARTSLALSSLSNYPAHTPYSASSPSGTLHLTNRRIVYLPATTTTTNSTNAPTNNNHVTSFAAPLTHIHDTRVTTPWLGPNVWVALIQPVAGGGLPAGMPAVEARLTFKEGGAYDFHNKFCQVKERLAQVLEARAMSGVAQEAGGGGGGMSEEDVHLEQLPAYEEVGSPVQPGGVVQQGIAPPSSGPPRSMTADQQNSPAENTTHADATGPPPAEPPPGYEEAQRDSVTEEMERGLRYRGARSDGGEER